MVEISTEIYDERQILKDCTVRVTTLYYKDGILINQEEQRTPDCTVEVLRNSVTGEESWGWYE